jgi:hypothetical protein
MTQENEMGLITGGLTVVKTAAAPYVGMLAPFWPLIWRALLVAGIFWLGWHYGGKTAERELDEFKTAQATATATAVSALQVQIANQELELVKKESENDKALEDLKDAQAARPAPVVRVCRSNGSGAVSGVSRPSGGASANAGREGELSEGVGVDIGKPVQKLVDRAEIVLTKCLQQEERSDFLSSQSPVTIPVKTKRW